MSDTATESRRKKWFRLQFGMRSLLIMHVVATLVVLTILRHFSSTWSRQSTAVTTTWDVRSGTNIKWRVRLGSPSDATPVISGGKVFVGTNNKGEYLTRFPKSVDLGVLLCFRESDGKFLWQASTPKFSEKPSQDRPEVGVGSTPLVEHKRLWYVTNRGEVVCLDTEGFHDGKNDGPYKEEATESREEADIVWIFDMRESLHLSPQRTCCSSVVSAGDALFVVTGHGVSDDGNSVTGAASFLALDKRTGKVLWSDDTPGEYLLDGQWGSPAVANIDGVMQVVFPGGDGWIYSFDARGDGNGNSQLLWKFDGNPKPTRWEPKGAGDRNTLVAAPVIHKNRVYVAMGRHPDDGDWPGHLWCIDARRRGDVSPDLVYSKWAPDQPIRGSRTVACDYSKGEFSRRNSNSAVVWHFHGSDLNHDGFVHQNELFSRSISRVAIRGDLLIALDIRGVVYCLDLETGLLNWSHYLGAPTLADPVIAGEFVYVTDAHGNVSLFRLSADPNVAMDMGGPHMSTNMLRPIFSRPVIANGALFIATQDQLFAIQQGRTSHGESGSNP